MVGIALPGATGPVAGGTTSNPVVVNVNTFPDNEPFDLAQYGGVALGAGNALHVQPGTAATWDISDRAARDLGTVDVTDFGAAQTDADDDVVAAAQTSLRVISLLYGYDGTQWERVTTNTTGALDVEIQGTPTVNIGTFPDNEPFNLAQVGGTTVVTGGTAGTLAVGGIQARDVAISGNQPVLIGGRGSAAEPTAVDADGDLVDAWMDTFGRLVTIPGHPSPEAPDVTTLSANGSLIATPGASVSLYICKGSVHNSAASEQVAALRDGSGGTIRWQANLAADGGGSVFDFGARGWKLTANTPLFGDAASASLYYNITEYYIAP
jgi:hypothetical protein